MTEGDHHTHRALAAQPMTLDLTTHTHGHALDNRDRIAVRDQAQRARS